MARTAEERRVRNGIFDLIMKRKPGVLLKRITDYFRLSPTRHFVKNVVRWQVPQPVVSFTFDDFPRSAFRVGGAILEKYHVRGSFYASFGLLGTYTSAGEMFTQEDLEAIMRTDHEIGCHTYDHMDAWKTSPDIFEASILKNLAFLMKLCPDRTIWTFSYPRSEPHLKIKAIAARYFAACRAGGQTNNNRTVDLNLVRSCFIDQKNYNNLNMITDLIEKNAKEKCWLVFSTHDVGHVISPFGCPKDVFEEIVARTVESGSVVLPVIDVCARIAESHRP